jgi:hypothetical protein
VSPLRGSAEIRWAASGNLPSYSAKKEATVYFPSADLMVNSGLQLIHLIPDAFLAALEVENSIKSSSFATSTMPAAFLFMMPAVWTLSLLKRPEVVLHVVQILQVQSRGLEKD